MAVAISVCCACWKRSHERNPIPLKAVVFRCIVRARSLYRSRFAAHSMLPVALLFPEIRSTTSCAAENL